LDLPLCCVIANSFTGSTHTLTPRQFIDDLKVLELGGVGSKAIPHGLQEHRGEHQTFQEFYDEKYFTNDAPPPKPAPTPLAAPQSKSSKSALSPTHSFTSSGSATSYTKEEKKKKKGLFRFGLQ
jgi:syntaxin-binding protein 1